MKKAIIIVAVLMLICLCGVVSVYLHAVKVFKEPGPLDKETFFIVSSGENLSVITNNLESEGIISHPNIFIFNVRKMKVAAQLKAGEYKFEPAISQSELVDSIIAGKTYQRKITIPEGLTSYQIVGLVNEEEMLSGEVETVPAEGSLLPETYSYIRKEGRASVISRMKKSMDATLEELWQGREEGLPFETPDQALVLASIVEKETGTPEERSRIAGVFINRLNRNMLLQSDPTVIYAINNGEHQDDGNGPLGRRLLRKDLETDSPYNTYRYPGLPPGPIANPGREAIEAVMHPEKHKFLYFVADGTGGHAFAKTLKEHNNNVANWRKVRPR